MGTPEQAPSRREPSSNSAVMDYYDGNTVTALCGTTPSTSRMGDNMYGTTYGPSTPGALNVTSAQTYGTICGPSSATINDARAAHPRVQLDNQWPTRR